jgi:hypothetical protein
VNETVFESSSSFVNRPEEYGDITGSSIGGLAASAAVPAGSWPPGSVPEIQSGFIEHQPVGFRSFISLFFWKLYVEPIISTSKTIYCC